MDIKYIGFFDHVSNAREGRAHALSAASKMEYIADALNRLGHRVLIISPSQTKHRRYFPGHTRQLTPMTWLRVFPTYPRGTIAQRLLRVVAGKIFLLAYLLRNTRAGEPVLVYHSLDIQEVVLVAKVLRRFRLILEVEEIYQDVVNTSRWKRKTEYALFGKADAFIFSTELLDEKLNTGGKPHAVVYGTYKRPEQTGKSTNDGRTHVVYAGTLDPRKGGAAAAAAAAAYLDGSFHIHILGFGSDSDIAAMKRAVSRVSSANAGLVSFDGVLRGKEYSKFLRQCDVGLSTQNPSAEFNDSSFPSKILSYLAHGLKVVTVRIPAIERSRIAPAVTFYDHQEPPEIAEAIREAVSSRARDNIALIEQLDIEFMSSLARLVEAVKSQGGCR
ncbi:Glycosyltransferase involved in cell wall bisynthesis [Raineyella antarctica]|uniref:Glycosyltransferase involved in cell wall bisynthesis n=1 Tax=Raineyella antarctica TaxID=1577474 RepID=A0A1G6GF67_9ACTN|nr:glycosyltransferase [Raineyella antarctica]SDB80395.1 Glycosyltransferase involved in cell wall bisynthesis [Raineyella antarctica]